MEIIHSPQDARQWRASCQGTVGFVPTMGALHQGHLALMKHAKTKCDHVIASVFVNPTQFGQGEDFDTYPRQLAEDAALCESVGVSMLFAPTSAQMYPEGHCTVIHLNTMGDHLCGAHREGHFDGVTTIVAKFLTLLTPDVAAFGQKDYQQLALIRQLAKDLYLPTTIIGVPTVREPDGLAMSSRNRYLTQEDRRDALRLSGALYATWEAWRSGQRDPAKLLSKGQGAFEGYPREKIDYLELVHPVTLARLTRAKETSEGAVLAVAAHVGAARLIDNIRLDGELPQELLGRG